MTALADSLRPRLLVLLVAGCHAGAPSPGAPVTNRIVAGNSPGWMVVAGQVLPVHTTTEPRDDIAFVAPAASVLAQRYRDEMLSFEPEPGVQGRGAVDPSTTQGLSLRLVRVFRDAKGNLYLYRACDDPNRPVREVIGDRRRPRCTRACRRTPRAAASGRACSPSSSSTASRSAAACRAASRGWSRRRCSAA